MSWIFKCVGVAVAAALGWPQPALAERAHRLAVVGHAGHGLAFVAPGADGADGATGPAGPAGADALNI